MPITLNGDTGIVTPMYNGSITANAVTPSVNMKNRLINSAMVIDQRNAGAATANTINGYTLDRWVVQQSTTGKVIAQQNAGSVTPPVGYTNYLGVTSQSAYSVGSSDYYSIYQNIEGFNIADLNWGTANAQTVTLSFWVRSSLTGTFGGSLRGGQNYPFTYTISAANTWEQKTITIVGSTSGSWNTTNSTGVGVWISLGAGSVLSGTAGAWTGSNVTTATGATSVVGTNGATFYITGVQLEVGSTATSFDYRPYGTELALCQRYYWQRNSETTYAGIGAGTVTATNTVRISFNYPVPMRATPTISVTNIGNTIATQGGDLTPSGITPYANSTGAMADLLVSGATVGRGVVWLFNATVSASVQATAEL